MYRNRLSLSLCHISWVARFLTQIGYRIALAATPLLALGSAQLTEAQTTIQVTTTQQGVTDANNCSLQEAIYAAEFGSNTALNLTDPDRFYTTGCVLQGASGPFTIVLQKSVYSFNTFWDRDAHNPFGLTATPIIFANITIQGNGATLQWTGSGNSRLFAVGSASIFDTLDNKTVSGTGALTARKRLHQGIQNKRWGRSRAEAAEVLVQVERSMSARSVRACPTLDVENSTFDSNFAIGGNGGPRRLRTFTILVEVAAAVACPAMVDLAAGGGGGGGGGSRGHGGWSSVVVEAAEVAPSSMAQTVTSRAALADTSAVAAEAADDG